MTYIDYHCEAPRIAERLTDLATTSRILYVDCRHERTRAVPSDVLARDGYIDGSYDVLVLRGGPGFAAVVAADEALRDWELRSVLVITGSDDVANRGPQLTVPPWAREAASPPSLELLREIELWGLVVGRGALLGSSGEHFQLRSGMHIEQYLRLRDACIDALDAERLADWLLPYVQKGTVVLGDRPNMGMLVQATALSCKRRFNWDIEGLTLDPWPRNERSSARVIEDLSERGDHILAVLGADHAARHEAELAMLSSIDATAVCLVDITPDGPQSRLAFRHHPIARWPQNNRGRCSACERHSRLLRIDPSKEDVTSHLVRQPARLLKRHYQSRMRFWRAVHESEALSIHSDVEYDDGVRTRHRHRPIHVNMRLLLRDAWFRGVCRSTLRTIERPDLVIVPRHHATPGLTRILTDVWDEPIKDVVQIVPRGGLTDELRAELPNAERILFVDDALITGQTLCGMVESVRDTLEGSERDHEVSAFVALCCPPDHGVVERLHQAMAAFGGPEQRGQQHLHYGRLAFLPDGESCAFCDERRWLQLLRRLTGPFEDLVDARLAQLTEPIHDGTLLFATDGATESAARAVAFGGQELPPTVAHAAAASAAQEARAEMRSADGHLVRYLDTRHAIVNHGSAPVLAGILRTFTEDEINYDVGAGLPVEGILEAGSSLTTRALTEIGWAAVTDKLPVAHAQLVDAAMRRDTRDRVVKLMRHLLQQRTRAA